MSKSKVSKSPKKTHDTCIKYIQKGVTQKDILQILSISKVTLKTHLLKFNTNWKQLTVKHGMPKSTGKVNIKKQQIKQQPNKPSVKVVKDNIELDESDIEEITTDSIEKELLTLYNTTVSPQLKIKLFDFLMKVWEKKHKVPDSDSKSILDRPITTLTEL